GPPRAAHVAHARDPPIELICNVDQPIRIQGDTSGQPELSVSGLPARGRSERSPIGAVHVVHALDSIVVLIRNIDAPEVIQPDAGRGVELINAAAAAWSSESCPPCSQRHLAAENQQKGRQTRKREKPLFHIDLHDADRLLICPATRQEFVQRQSGGRVDSGTSFGYTWTAVKKKKPVVISLRKSLSYEPVELAFGTSGLRGLVKDITNLEAYVNVRGFLAWLLKGSEIEKGGTVFAAG